MTTLSERIAVATVSKRLSGSPITPAIMFVAIGLLVLTVMPSPGLRSMAIGGILVDGVPHGPSICGASIAASAGGVSYRCGTGRTRRNELGWTHAHPC